MSNDITLSRRKFIFSFLIATTSAITGYGIYKLHLEKQHSAEIDDLLVKLGSNDASKTIFKIYGKFLPPLRNLHDIQKRASRLLYIPNGFLNRKRIIDSIEFAIQRDLSNNNTVLIDGWILTKTEAELYCLSVLTEFMLAN